MKKDADQRQKAQIAELEQRVAFLEKAVAQSEVERHDFLSQILNTIGDPVFVKDAESRLLFVNKAFCDTFNQKRENIIGKTLAENVPPEERESFLAIDREVILTGIEKINEESLTVGGQPRRIISTRKSRFTDAENRRYLVGVLRDITERYDAEKKLAKSEARLETLNHTKDKIFSIVAHDLRNPIGSLLGLSEILAEEESNFSDAERKMYYKMIHDSVRSTFQLLENLLNWANLQKGTIRVKPKVFKLKNHLDEILESAHASAHTKSINIITDLDPEITVNTDPDLLATIIRNLVSNAIKFSHRGDEVEVKAYVKEEQVKVTISDHGVGMCDSKSKNLFGVLGSSTPGTANEKGSGLGLMLCKDFAELLGGEITVESQPDKGSYFTFSVKPTSCLRSGDSNLMRV